MNERSIRPSLLIKLFIRYREPVTDTSYPVAAPVIANGARDITQTSPSPPQSLSLFSTPAPVFTSGQIPEPDFTFKTYLHVLPVAQQHDIYIRVVHTAVWHHQYGDLKDPLMWTYTYACHTSTGRRLGLCTIIWREWAAVCGGLGLGETRSGSSPPKTSNLPYPIWNGMRVNQYDDSEIDDTDEATLSELHDANEEGNDRESREILYKKFETSKLLPISRTDIGILSLQSSPISAEPNSPVFSQQFNNWTPINKPIPKPHKHTPIVQDTSNDDELREITFNGFQGALRHSASIPQIATANFIGVSHGNASTSPSESSLTESGPKPSIVNTRPTVAKEPKASDKSRICQ